MKQVQPEVHLVARPHIDRAAMNDYLESVGGEDWMHTKFREDGEDLAEFAGRACYRSWQPGLNPNVSRVRNDRRKYLENILSSAHGSVLEHANYTFAFRHISRVVTHELARHRAGTAISQESMRYVRLDDIPFWLPEWVRKDKTLMRHIEEELARAEQFQRWMADWFCLDDEGTPFHEKKAKTSFMRRFAPGGVATDMVWTANVRALRHIIEVRTAPAAEEEIRIVFGKVAEIMAEELPILFGDFAEEDGAYVPTWRKV